MKDLDVDNCLSERQDCVGQVAEGEVAAIYEKVRNRHDDLANSNGEPMEEPRRVRAEGGSDYEGEEGRDEVHKRE